ncbi:ASKHA domain-containing protein [Parasporobacterium paucivorans]|uniref:Uncharacterized 2Fe-2 and 4Fe-4S clusters-containing protein, contains DUF4445 domain n=1 Tax=Parasporobacterium paucivorans DSM 15970 TaxID=1122934 RepID=A0A1M6GAR9_9FIRM|nr:ASKHA domain-containing protein [Parasporobacterium paucivorans]SHJ06947.1 Uncharacterized 2Fe-2 and 4Fe-4S clusters-containing protein, contains DUF4445 domain [Parasporobacterium paucivorans DSM 15970]
MNEYKVKILPMQLEVMVEEGTTLLEAQRLAGLEPDAPCGGKGTCGKCLIEILSDGPVRTEKACANRVTQDMTIRVIEKNKGHRLLMEGASQEIDVKSAISSAWIKVDPPKIGNHNTEWQRVKNALSKVYAFRKDRDFKIELPLLSGLYEQLKDNDGMVDTILYKNWVIDIRNKKTDKFGIAFDIGTTSIVGYLLNVETGEQKAVVSMLNPQTQFGGDVINRANYAIEEGVQILTQTVRKGLNELIEEAVQKAGIDKNDIFMASIVGNTCMHHLYLGISPKALVHAPYNPVMSEKLEMRADDLNMNINPNGRVIVLPNIAGFVGADTTGVLIATNFDAIEEMTLAIDIGTNGELVMGNKDHMIACSTAAGPAFEGAKIKCGMRGMEGAIDHFELNGTTFKYSVIGDLVPLGICGSGLMDIVAVLLDAEIIDETGKLVSAETAQSPAALANIDRLVELNKERIFVIYRDEQDPRKNVFLSQQDIREVQLAKGAMAAGIDLMAKTLGIGISDVKKVLIAGAFGNYMSPKSACRIGLIPQELSDRITPIGNAAGEGAKIAVLNYCEFQKSEKITQKVEFLELATRPDFQDCFIDHLSFE